MEQRATVEPTWLSYAEAGRLVGLSRTSLWRLAHCGEVKTARIGRLVRFNRQSLEDYMDKMSETED